MPVLLAALPLTSAAQVHRCTDSAGKISYSDSPCSTSAKRAEKVMGRDATEMHWEPEGYRHQQQLESAARAQQALLDTQETVTNQSRGTTGAGIIRHDPNERINQQSERNMARRRAQLEADAARRRQQDDYRDEIARNKAMAPQSTRLTNCNASGCWDDAGNRYNRTGDGRNLIGQDGRFCRTVGQQVICN
ncbi:DUF4124 domain-containing protein [Variovorax boronicumulans]|nr:DUF4124 domain-containing protein [Variovorax boronicumulans]